eukprot:155139-Amphidinium_carterae.1
MSSILISSRSQHYSALHHNDLGSTDVELLTWHWIDERSHEALRENSPSDAGSKHFPYTGEGLHRSAFRGWRWIDERSSAVRDLHKQLRGSAPREGPPRDAIGEHLPYGPQEVE